MILHFVKHTVRYLKSVHLIILLLRVCIKLRSKAVHFLTIKQKAKIVFYGWNDLSVQCYITCCEGMARLDAVKTAF